MTRSTTFRPSGRGVCCPQNGLRHKTDILELEVLSEEGYRQICRIHILKEKIAKTNMQIRNKKYLYHMHAHYHHAPL